jgi:hypothetical protein
MQHRATAQPGLASTAVRTEGHGRHWLAAPALFALGYPFFLKGYFLSLKAQGGPWLPALLLALAFGVPLLGFIAALRLGRVDRPDGAQLWGKRLALLAVAAPPVYTAAGVLLYMAGDPVADTTAWLLLWGALAVVGLVAALRSPAAARGKGLAEAAVATPAAVPARLRVAHGISALAILALFLAMHLSNHMAGLMGEAAHRQLMELFRVVYRAQIVEPLIVLLFLFQVVSGLALLRVHTARPADFFRTLQLASGAYLVLFILAHMNSVFFYARRFANIKTDWDFATGAPTGLLHDAWNIRLVPHYYLGVFLVLAHLALGARIVALNHGVSRAAADAWTKAGIALAALAALLIMLGMSGVHPLGNEMDASHLLPREAGE